MQVQILSEINKQNNQKSEKQTVGKVQTERQTDKEIKKEEDVQRVKTR